MPSALLHSATRTAIHYRAHCRTLPLALPHNATLLQIRTAADCCAHCHTLLPHCSKPLFTFITTFLIYIYYLYLLLRIITTYELLLRGTYLFSILII
jgi:hypothetical protein